MRDELLKLTELQKIDLELDKRKKALAALDDGSRAKQESIRLKQNQTEAAQAKRQIEKEYFDQDLRLKGIEEKKKKAEELMYSGKVSNLKELEDLQKEVAMFNREIDKISTLVLELMDQLEAAKKQEAGANTAVEDIEQELAKTLQSYSDDSTALKGEIAALEERRSQASSEVPAPLLQRYEKMQSKQGVFVAVSMHDEVCGGCHVTLSNHLLKAVRAASTIQTCESCNRMLIWIPDDD